MKKLEKFIKEVEQVGSVFDYGPVPLTMSDWDDIFRRLAEMGIKGEIIYYCSPRLSMELQQMLSEMNAGYSGGIDYGAFHAKDNSWSYMVEMSFLRGSHTIHAITKPMEGGLLVPTFPEEEWGTENLAKSAIKIKTNGN